ncbi:MAG: aminoglycoside N(3)-acetyltransferase [Phycisphaerales bacterium]
MPETSTIDPSAEPLTTDGIAATLRSVGADACPVLLVHCSLSALGWVCGGATAVIQAVLSVAGDEGTIVMPAHSAEYSDPKNWVNPPVPEEWWDTIRRTMPAFDPRTTPSREMGAVAEIFRTWPGTVRSNHPTASFAARGPLAAEIVRDQPLEDPLGADSPLARIAAAGGSVLLLGVGHGSNTMLHLAERSAFGSQQATNSTGSPIVTDTGRAWQPFAEPDVDSDDFPALGEHLDQVLRGDGNSPPATASLVTRALGPATVTRMLAAPAVNLAVPWLRDNRTRDGRV